MSLLRISELARRSETPASTLRYYDDRGLLPAQRSPAGYRLYDEAALERLAFISTAKDLGLELAEITELLGLWEERRCLKVQESLRSRVATRLHAAQERATELDHFQTTLRGALRRLVQPADETRACGPDCPCMTTHPTPVAEAVTLPSLSPAPTAHTCSLSDAQYVERVRRWRELLGDTEPYAGTEGRIWPLPAELAGAVAELAVAEVSCCPFLDLRIDFTTDAVRLHARLDRRIAPRLTGKAAEAARWLTGAPDETAEEAVDTPT